MREHIRGNRALADAMEKELKARHAPVSVLVPRSLLKRVQHVLQRPGLAQGELTWDEKAQLSKIVSEGLRAAELFDEANQVPAGRGSIPANTNR